MTDFQSFLKFFIEAEGDQPTGDPAAGAQAGGGGGIEGANTPAMAFEAYKGEYAALMKQLSTTVRQQMVQLDNLRSHATQTVAALGSKPETEKRLAGYRPKTPLPDPSALLKKRQAAQARGSVQPGAAPWEQQTGGTT